MAFGADERGPERDGADTVLTQYSVEDTLGDLVWNAFGGLFVALWGHLYLTNVVGALSARMGDGEDTPR
jgi:hypothetical protein